MTTNNSVQLPTPRDYQDMSVETDVNGTTYLYMGSDYVAFTLPEWQTFRQMIIDFKPVGPFAGPSPRELYASQQEAITNGAFDTPEHRFHDGESCFAGCPAWDSKLEDTGFPRDAEPCDPVYGEARSG